MSTYKKLQNIAQPTDFYPTHNSQPDFNPKYAEITNMENLMNNRDYMENLMNNRDFMENYNKNYNIAHPTGFINPHLHDIYCGELAGASAYANKETTMGTRSQCLEKGKYVAYRNTDYKFKKPIYCGTDTTLPDNYQSMGTIEQCFNRGGIHARYEDLHD
jgi:hypothetical protein